MIYTYIDILKADGSATYGELLISPINSPFAYSGSVVVGSNTIELNEQGNGVYVNLVPTAYTIRLGGYNSETQFIADLTNVADNTTASISNYIVSQPPTPIYTSSYSLAGPWVNYPDLTDNGNGSIGINQTNPQYALDIENIESSYLGINMSAVIGNYYPRSVQINAPIYLYGEGNGLTVVDAGNNMVHHLACTIDEFSSASYVNSRGGAFGVNTNNPQYPLDVSGVVNSNVGYYLNGSAWTPTHASTASYVSGPVIATTLAQLPYSSSAHSLSPVVASGSAYLQMSGSTMLLYAYSGTRWYSSSLA